jgi:hypothetical protein
MHWLLGGTRISIESRVLLYKAVLRPIWTYGIQLWRKSSNSNIKNLQRFQSKILLSILKAPWYINNNRIHEDLQMNTVISEIKKWNTSHNNVLAVNLLDNSEITQKLNAYTVLTLPGQPE